jgi:D-lyxose ketol-isomerase
VDKELQKKIRSHTVDYFLKAGIVLSKEEIENKIQIFDYGTGDFFKVGLVIVNFVNTTRYCGKFLLFFPGQTAAEHYHPDVDGNRGKEETFRVLWGSAYAYGEGEPTKNIKAKIPEGMEESFTVRKETILKPGDQYDVKLHEKHWWQAGPEGVVVLEVSSTSRDLADVYTDKSLDFNIF